MAKKAPTPTRVKGRIVIIDDEPAMGNILVKSLDADGFRATAYTSPLQGLESVRSDQPDVVLTDVRMPSLSGKDVLERLQSEYPEIPVIVMTAYGTIEDAVAALKAGAFTYITKPFQHESLVHQIELAMKQRHLEEKVEGLSDQMVPQLDARRIIGSSAGLDHVRKLIGRAAKIDSAVLITGESGVGKELVAREIHRKSERRDGRFITVNCPAIPATLIESEMFGYERGAFTGADRPKMGLIELAAGGTLFLDEIGELPVELQVKLLRVLQEHVIQRLGGLREIHIDLRVIAATNRNLEKEIEVGRFRMDLFYRINVIPIEAPPLREHVDDIPELAEYFLMRIGRKMNRPNLTLGDAVLHYFKHNPWPGNIRQLENVLERMVAFCSSDEIEVDSIPSDLLRSSERGGKADRPEATDEPPTPPMPINFKQARDQFERTYLKRILSDAGGNVALASRISGISRRSLYEKFEKLGLNQKQE